MSIFDVVKYPIDERFEQADLRRIPPRALSAWWYGDVMKVARWRSFALGYSPNPDDIYTMTCFMTADNARFLPAMARMLRRRIEEL